MNTQKKYITAFVLTLIVLGAGFGWNNMEKKGETSSEQDNEVLVQPVLENTTLQEGSLDHLDPNFSLKYPKTFIVTSFEDAEGETILIKNPSLGSEIQLYLSSFDEEITLTAARIKKDVPSLVMNGAMQIEIGKAVSGVYFKTTKQGIGESQEIWFVRSGYLYQISAYKTDEKILADLAASFQFK